MRSATLLYVGAEALVRRLADPLHPYWSGFWLGLLPERAVDAIDRTMYELQSSYRSESHNRRGLLPWEEEAVTSHFSGCGRVMVLGAGAGREVLALRRAGFAADGWECNPVLVEASRALFRAEGHADAVRVGPRSGVPEVDDAYGGVMLGWSMYMLVYGRARRVALLRGLRARLEAGAPVLLSFFTREPDDRRFARITLAAAPVRRLLGREPPEPGDEMTPGYVHWFTREDLRLELEAGGFRLVRWEPMGPGPDDSGWAVGVAV
jgi:hypothetical protein